MSKYHGQPTFGMHNSWYTDDEGITRNRWTDETPEQMRGRFRSNILRLEAEGLGDSPEARMLRKSISSS